MYLTDLVHHILVVKSNKAKASVSVRDFVVSQHGFFNLRMTGLGQEEKNISFSYLGEGLTIAVFLALIDFGDGDCLDFDTKFGDGLS